MKSKIAEIIIVIFIVLMLGGILGSVKNDSKDDQITEIISDFENQSDFNVSGYVPSEEFDEEYINGFGEFNGKLGDIITNGVNKGIDLFFEFVKKLVS